MQYGKRTGALSVNAVNLKGSRAGIPIAVRRGPNFTGPKGEPMMIVRSLVVAAIVLWTVAPVFAGQPGAVGKGLGTAATTSGQSGSHVSATPGQAAPAPGFSLAPGKGTSTATTTPANTHNPNPTNIGRGTTK